ncbi:MAG TPA: hypothetical protein VIX91_16480 [Candidatus Acidoferrum sp.]
MSVILTLRVAAKQRNFGREAAKPEGLVLSGWICRYPDDGLLQAETLKQSTKSPSERLAELLHAAG